jgi:hypothetical protein
MTYRKHTLRTMSPTARKVARLTSELVTQELSEIWSGTEVEEKIKQPKLFTEVEEILRGKKETEEEARPQAFAIKAEYQEGTLVAFNVADPDGAVIRERARLIAEVCQQYPQFTPEQLKDAKIVYSDYHARLEL